MAGQYFLLFGCAWLLLDARAPAQLPGPGRSWHMIGRLPETSHSRDNTMIVMPDGSLIVPHRINSSNTGLTILPRNWSDSVKSEVAIMGTVPPLTKYQMDNGPHGILAALPDGGLAMHAGNNLIDLYDLHGVQHAGQPYARLQTDYLVRSMSTMYDGGLAVGTATNKVELFSASTVQGGSVSVRKLDMPGIVTEVLALRSGPLAVGINVHSILLIDTSREDISNPELYLQIAFGEHQAHTTDIRAFVELPDCGLAVARNTGEILLYSRGAVLGHEKLQPYANLSNPPSHTSLKKLAIFKPYQSRQYHLVVAAGSHATQRLFFYNISRSALEQRLSPYFHFSVESGLTSALLVLPSGDFVIGGQRGTIFVFDQRGVEKERFRCPRTPESLLELRGGGVAAGILFNPTSLFILGHNTTAIHSVHYRMPRRSDYKIMALLDDGTVVCRAELDRRLVLWNEGHIMEWRPPFELIFKYSRLPDIGISTFGPLPNGGLVIGTSIGNVWLLTSSALRQNGMPYVILRAENEYGKFGDPIMFTMVLNESGLAVASYTEVRIFHRLLSDPSGARMDAADATLQVRASDGCVIHSMEQLANGALILGCDQSHVVLVFSPETVFSGGHATSKLLAGANVSSLLAFARGSLAVGRHDGKIDFFDSWILRSGGAPYATFDAHGDIRFMHAVSTDDPDEGDIVIINKYVYKSKKCPGGTSSPGGGAMCEICAGSWRAEPGSAACMWTSSHRLLALVTVGVACFVIPSIIYSIVLTRAARCSQTSNGLGANNVSPLADSASRSFTKSTLLGLSICGSGACTIAVFTSHRCPHAQIPDDWMKWQEYFWPLTTTQVIAIALTGILLPSFSPLRCALLGCNRLDAELGYEAMHPLHLFIVSGAIWMLWMQWQTRLYGGLAKCTVMMTPMGLIRAEPLLPLQALSVGVIATCVVLWVRRWERDALEQSAGDEQLSAPRQELSVVVSSRQPQYSNEDKLGVAMSTSNSVSITLRASEVPSGSNSFELGSPARKSNQLVFPKQQLRQTSGYSIGGHVFEDVVNEGSALQSSFDHLTASMGSVGFEKPRRYSSKVSFDFKDSAQLASRQQTRLSTASVEVDTPGNKIRRQSQKLLSGNSFEVSSAIDDTVTSTAYKAGCCTELKRRVRQALAIFVESFCGRLLCKACGYVVAGVTFCFDVWRHWTFRQGVFTASSVLNLSIFLPQISRMVPHDAREIPLYVCVVLAALGMFTSTYAVACRNSRPPFSYWVDWHFRYAVVLKSMLVVAKSVMLTMQFSHIVRVPEDIPYVWGCEDSVLCPQWCAQTMKGTCVTQEFSGQGKTGCQCIGRTSARSHTVILSIISGIILAISSTGSTIRIWRSYPDTTDGPSRLYLIGHVANQVFLCTLIAVTVWTPATCYSGRPAFAFHLSWPLVPASLLSNEARWIMETWKTWRNPYRHGPIWDCRSLPRLYFFTLVSALWGGLANASSKITATKLNWKCQTLHVAGAYLLIVLAGMSAAALFLSARHPQNDQELPTKVLPAHVKLGLPLTPHAR